MLRMHRDGSRSIEQMYLGQKIELDYHMPLRKRTGEVEVIQREEKIDTYLHRMLMVDHCVSKKTTPSEANYHSSRLELLAIVWSVRLRTMLLPICFTIVTDCQGIMYASRGYFIPSARWMMVLSECNYKIVHTDEQLKQL
nr:unnamed protein product [Callosobruchus analis]